jgi:hypothetical protein
LGGNWSTFTDAINPAGDKDFYFYPATSQEWLKISATKNPNNSANQLDTIISIYNSNGSNLLARNNNSVFFDNNSHTSNLIYKPTNNEKLCIKVEDASHLQAILQKEILIIHT